MICFSLVAHENEKALFDQIKNINQMVKNSLIILYNGGKDPEFGKKASFKYRNVKLCPYSRPLANRKTGRVLYDVTRWLKEEKIKYDFLVYLEADTMFLKPGFAPFLRRVMKGGDFIGQSWSKFNPRKDKPDAPASILMIKDWERWQPFFGTNYFCRTSNPFQAYRKSMVEKILDNINDSEMEYLFSTSPVECLGEMIFPTFAHKLGAKMKEYPRSFAKYNRWRPKLTIKDLKEAYREGKYLFVHPVKDDYVRAWIMKKNGNR